MHHQLPQSEVCLSIVLFFSSRSLLLSSRTSNQDSTVGALNDSRSMSGDETPESDIFVAANLPLMMVVVVVVLIDVLRSEKIHTNAY